MWRRWLIGALLACTGVITLAHGAAALEVPPAPSLQTPIVDQTGTLSPRDIQALSTQIASGRQQKSYQIGILIIPTLGNDEYLEGYSLKVARAWGVGEKDTSNGVLILVVKNDRKMRIEVGRGLEGDLTDLEAGQIVRDVLSPRFKKGKFYDGLAAAIASIQAQVEGKPDPNLNKAVSTVPGAGDIVTAVLVIIGWMTPGLLWIGSILARSKSWWLGGVIGLAVGGFIAFITQWAVGALIAWGGLTAVGFLLDFFVSRNYKAHSTKGDSPSWWAGGGTFGGWGGGSSSGGGSFGGGGFSGGGSSGSW